MEPFRFHVFVCDQQKPEGVPCCAARGSGQVLEALRREINARGLEDEVQVTTCGSLGLCEHGPNLVVYPEGVWYSGVTPADVPEIVRSHFQEDTPVERLAAHRSRRICARRSCKTAKRCCAARRAREAAGVLPDELNERIRGFQESRVILTALELDLFTAVGEGAGAVEVAAVLHTDPRATEMLLNALASLRLLVKQDGSFHNSTAAARYFTAGSRDNARPALLHTAHLWQRWSTLTDCVRAGTAVAAGRRSPAAARTGPRPSSPPCTATPRNGRRWWCVRWVRRTSAACWTWAAGRARIRLLSPRRTAALRADILDLATVEPIARRHIEAAGVTDRVGVRAGDLRVDQLGEGYDLVFVSAICHMLSAAENLDLLRRCREALAPGGRVVIQDFILEADKTAPRFAALFALNMLVGTRGGSSYSEPEYAGWLERGGIPGDPTCATAGNHGLDDRRAGVARGVDMSVDAARTECVTTLATSAVLCNTRWQMQKLVCVFSLFLIPLAAQPPASGTWKFAVSGDSRNCGDIVMPAIASGVLASRSEFYWHLGDFRAIYTFDEDMVPPASLGLPPKPLTIISYETTAWPDFIAHQLAPFGALPVLLTPGNHETIPPATREQYLLQFADWLDDADPARAASAGRSPGSQTARVLPLDQPQYRLHRPR